jgi:adenylylsulfate kinase
MAEIFPIYERILSRDHKEMKLKQRSLAIWFTGLSGAGKTTLASALEQDLFEKGFFTQFLDGDNIRDGINNNLGFSDSDRIENIRRVSEVAKLFIHSGIITICSFISPTEHIRNLAKKIIGEENFFEVYLSTPIDVCEARDVKGLYVKARKGLIMDFTGITSPFEAPLKPDLSIDTSCLTIKEGVSILQEHILPKISHNNTLMQYQSNNYSLMN